MVVFQSGFVKPSASAWAAKGGFLASPSAPPPGLCAKQIADNSNAALKQEESR